PPSPGRRSSCIWPPLARRERDQKTSVRVVRGKEVAFHRLLDPCASRELELLAEPAHAPFEGELRRVPVGREPGEAEALDDVAAEERRLRVAGQLEDAAAGSEHAPLLVADDEPCV